MSIKNLAKQAAYSIFPQELPKGLKLNIAYTFHTESLFEDAYFLPFIQFLRDYRSLTGKKALATLMSGANPRVRDGAKGRGMGDRELADRMLKVGELAELGFHGHYAFEPERYRETPMQIRGGLYDIASIEKQIDAELEWFKRMGLELGPFYSGGWWFQAPELYALLAERGFKLDASVSYSPWFRQANTYFWFQLAKVLPGEAVIVLDKIAAVQNLIGCHDTPFPDDFIRHLRKIIGRETGLVSAFVHSHDFDLKPVFALRALERIRREGASFCEASDFLSRWDDFRRISLPEKLVGGVGGH